MQIGINWISPASLPGIQNLIAQGHVSFCEIMVDNFAHLPAADILKALPDVPVSLHIVTSCFLEKSAAELSELANTLRPWIKELNPLYVSDHLLRFTTQDGKYLPVIEELDYEQEYEHIRQRVNLWQSLLETQLLFENHASVNMRGKNQPDFFARLMLDTDAGLLFDFSNAYIAEYNQICTLNKWDALIRRAKHFHTAGFRLHAPTGIALDTHDMPVAEEVLAVMKKYFSDAGRQQTLVVEFDVDVKEETWANEIEKIRKSMLSIDFHESISEQNLQHKLFHYAPALRTINGNFSAPFLQHAKENHLSMNWALHIHLLNWLMQQKNWQPLITEEITKDLLTAAAIRWSLNGLDHVTAKGMMVASRHAPGLAIALWKNREAQKPARIVHVPLPENLRPAEDSYVLSYEQSNWGKLKWLAIPK